MTEFWRLRSYSLFFPAAFALFQRNLAAAAILALPATDMVRFGVFTLAQRFFCARPIFRLAAADMPLRGRPTLLTSETKPRICSNSLCIDSIRFRNRTARLSCASDMLDDMRTNAGGKANVSQAQQLDARLICGTVTLRNPLQLESWDRMSTEYGPIPTFA